jgi:hypothetical protein
MIEVVSWARLVTLTEVIRKAYRILVENVKGRNLLEYIGVVEKITLGLDA